MGRKHRSTLQNYVEYIHNDIVKNFRVGILQYSEHTCKMHNLVKYISPTSMKGGEYDQKYWTPRKINYLRMRFVLQLRTYFLHPCRINWRKKLRTMLTHPMKNGMTFCSPWRLKITGKEPRIKSKILRPLSQSRPILIAMYP